MAFFLCLLCLLCSVWFVLVCGEYFSQLNEFELNFFSWELKAFKELNKVFFGMEKCIFHKNLELSFGAIVRRNYQGIKFANVWKLSSVLLLYLWMLYLMLNTIEGVENNRDLIVGWSLNRALVLIRNLRFLWTILFGIVHSMDGLNGINTYSQ